MVDAPQSALLRFDVSKGVESGRRSRLSVAMRYAGHRAGMKRRPIAAWPLCSCTARSFASRLYGLCRSTVYRLARRSRWGWCRQRSGHIGHSAPDQRRHP